MSWPAALAIFLLGGLVGFAIAAVLGAGAREEAEREAAYWRQQAQIWLAEIGELRTRTSLTEEEPRCHESAQ